MIFGPYYGVVHQVRDGDTIYCQLDLGFDLTVYARVRVFGINAPELYTDAGKAAKAFADSLLQPGSPVMVTSHGWDKFGGRVDGDIRYGTAYEKDFASEMLANGFAVPYKA
jgi:endonuclease YncB( thermonuclease family)